MIEPTVKLASLTVVTSSSALVAMVMTPSEITAITIAAGALIATVFTGIVNIIAALRAEKKIDHAIIKVDEVSAKSDVISGHVNSAASSASTKIDALQSEVNLLRQLLSDSKQTALMSAAAEASREQARLVTDALHATPDTKT